MKKNDPTKFTPSNLSEKQIKRSYEEKAAGSASVPKFEMAPPKPPTKKK